MDLDALLERCWFPAHGAQVRCGVSGGADSLALLVLATRAGCEVTAVHVDHGLRPGGSDEAAAVRDAAEQFGASFEAAAVSVAEGPNLEARARAERHTALGSDALLGHTMDDQAETVLLAMLRGAGVEGLAGMRPDRRPMLALRRAQTVEITAAAGLVALDDPSNADSRFRRNRVRHEVLPLLGDVAQRDIVPILARQADVMRGVADHLVDEAANVDPTDARAAGDVPDALMRVAVRAWLRGASTEGHPPDAAALDRVLAVLHGTSIGTEIAGGVRVRRSDGRLRLEPPAPVAGVDPTR